MTAPSTVLSQIRDQAAESSAAFWTDTEIYRHLSDGQTIVSQEIGCTEDTTSFATTSGTREYSIPSNVGTVIRLTWDSYRCNRIDLNQLDDLEGTAYGGIDQSGYPNAYYQFADKIGFSPVPDSTATVNLYYYAIPTDVTTSSTAFQIPDTYSRYLVDYCLWRMFTKDQQLQEDAAFYKEKWDEDVKLMRHDWSQRKFRDRVAIPVVVDDTMME